MRKLLLLLVILSCNPLLAKKYYFTPGESESLKRILSEGKLLPGDEVILKDGVFKNLQKVLFQAKGTVQDSIKLKAEHPGKTIISGLWRISANRRFVFSESMGIVFQYD